MTLPTPNRRWRWPTVIGFIAVVGGVLDVLGGSIGVALNFTDIGWVPVLHPAQYEVARHYAVLNLISMVVVTVISALLIVVGIGILRRRPWSRSAAIGWGVTKSLYLILFSGNLLNKAQDEAMQQAVLDDTGTPMMNSGGPEFFMLWDWGLPVFLIIWFMWEPVETEVDRWARG